ncbi:MULTISPECIES: hypothetical protein [Frankia]|uniref:hypothetical protein n=1 Tax=Frankia TaxID=1854 RepID=UPI0012FFCDE0|nr:MULTISPECIES: hypothetical protein [Frankia]
MALQAALVDPQSAGNSLASWLDGESEASAVCVVFRSWSYVSRDVLVGVRWEVHRNPRNSDDDSLESPAEMAFELVSQFVEEPLDWRAFRLVLDRHGIGWMGTVEQGPPAVPDWVLERVRRSG